MVQAIPVGVVMFSSGCDLGFTLRNRISDGDHIIDSNHAFRNPMHTRAVAKIAQFWQKAAD
jgi:hypothetical protein